MRESAASNYEVRILYTTLQYSQTLAPQNSKPHCSSIHAGLLWNANEYHESTGFCRMLEKINGKQIKEKSHSGCSIAMQFEWGKNEGIPRPCSDLLLRTIQFTRKLKISWLTSDGDRRPKMTKTKKERRTLKAASTGFSRVCCVCLQRNVKQKLRRRPRLGFSQSGYGSGPHYFLYNFFRVHAKHADFE